MKRSIYHVTPHPDGGWQVRREGSDRATSRHETQSQATERGRKLAKQERVELVIHRTDGTIGRKDSYGSDPNPPKEKD